jgi:hypothetical protein
MLINQRVDIHWLCGIGRISLLAHLLGRPQLRVQTSSAIASNDLPIPNQRRAGAATPHTSSKAWSQCVSMMSAACPYEPRSPSTNSSTHGRSDRSSKTDPICSSSRRVRSASALMGLPANQPMNNVSPCLPNISLNNWAH